MSEHLAQCPGSRSASSPLCRRHARLALAGFLKHLAQLAQLSWLALPSNRAVAVFMAACPRSISMGVEVSSQRCEAARKNIADYLSTAKHLGPDVATPQFQCSDFTHVSQRAKHDNAVHPGTQTCAAASSPLCPRCLPVCLATGTTPSRPPPYPHRVHLLVGHWCCGTARRRTLIPRVRNSPGTACMLANCGAGPALKLMPGSSWQVLIAVGYAGKGSGTAAQAMMAAGTGPVRLVGRTACSMAGELAPSCTHTHAWLHR